MKTDRTKILMDMARVWDTGEKSAIIRPEESDFDELVEVWEASVRATHSFLEDTDIAFLKPLIRGEYMAQVDLYGVRDGQQRIAAFMGVSRQKIEMLFVHPEMRGKGVGSQLVLHAILCLGVRYVDVNEQNEQAVGFYEYIGFERIGREEEDGQGKPFPILQMRFGDSDS